MATCPECEADVDVDADEIDKGDVITCRECGSDLEVISLSPLEFDIAEDEDEDKLDEGDDEDLLDEDDDEEEDWDE
jgi:alpha-aminoadipate carrier protein LysW